MQVHTTQIFPQGLFDIRNILFDPYANVLLNNLNTYVTNTQCLKVAQKVSFAFLTPNFFYLYCKAFRVFKGRDTLLWIFKHCVPSQFLTQVSPKGSLSPATLY